MKAMLRSLCLLGLLATQLAVAATRLPQPIKHFAPLFWYAYRDSAERIHESLVTLEAHGLPLQQALARLASQVGGRLTYDATQLPRRLIHISLQRVPLKVALDSLLAGTNLSVWASPSGQLVLVPILQAPEADPTPQHVVQGQVTDAETNQPLPGVNVVVKGKMIGTTTNLEGFYTLEVPSPNDTLVFSFVGYRGVEIPINGRTRIDVQLMPAVEELGEIVVIGYGTQQRVRVTGSIASLPMEKVAELPTFTFENAILGRLPGVQVQETSGEPGAAPTVRVRGTRSITAGNDPLYVIDGFPVTSNPVLQGSIALREALYQPPPINPLAALNPDDIASVEVLKDASAAAIYGSRGANGVILITTRKGRRDGSIQVRYNGYVGLQEVARKPDLMNARELIEYTIDARNNNYREKYGQDPPNPRTNEGRPNDDFVRIPEKYINWDGTDTDWLDLIFRTAPTVSQHLSIAGGAEKIGYYVAGSYLMQEGLIDGPNNLTRYSLRVNLEADPHERLRLNLNLTSAFTRTHRLPADAPYFARPPGIIYSALVHSPVVKPYNEDGTPNQLDNQSYLGGGTTSASNPLAIIEAVTDVLDNHRTFGTLSAGYTLRPGLVYRLNLGVDLNNYQRAFYQANSLLFRTATRGEPFGQANASQSLNWLIEHTLSYDVSFKNAHYLSALAGYTAQKETIDLSQVEARNFPDDKVKTISGGQVTGGSGVQEAWSLVSMLARLSYSYRDRYLVSASIRADRSSRFGRNRQTGVFPSLSVGWRLHEEPFMQGLRGLFSELKLRSSYGVTGNFQIPNYASISLLDQANYVIGNQVVLGAAPATLGDQNLTWETTRQLNLGLDVGLLADRIYFTAEFYNSITEDLLLYVNVPTALGYETALTNIGKVRNRGFEFSLTSRNLVGAFTWETDFNLSLNRNKVLALGPENAPIYALDVAGLRYVTQVGAPIGSYYGFVVDGIYQSQAEIAQAPIDRLARKPGPGDFRFKDIDGDGDVDNDDRTIIGSYFPDYTFGITNRFGYKNFDLTVFIQGVQGHEILNLTSRHLKNGEANFNSYAIFNYRWRSPQEPGNGKVPRADRQTDLHGNNNRPSTFQVEDGSYVRVRSVTLGYTLPQRLLGRYVSQARVYLTATNLFTWTDYLGFNPEVSMRAESALTPGLDYGTYPLARTYTLGISLAF
jgi:TonB-linked SusC/RagA family outer membrane protein